MKKTISTYLRSLIVAAFCLFITLPVLANHIVGIDMNYTWISGNTYQVTIVAYGDCGVTSPSLIGNAPEICVYNGNTSVGSFNLTAIAPTTGTEVTPVCPAAIGTTTCSDLSSTIEGVKRYVYSGTYTLPGTSQYWRFIFNGRMRTGAGGSSAGRATTITNINGSGSSIIQLIDTVDNRYVNNSSPILTVHPTPYFCQGNPNSYNPGAIDPDGDSLVFTLVRGRVASNSCFSIPTGSGLVDYVTTFPAWTGQPITETTPLRVVAGEYSFDQNNGQITFTPNFPQRALVVYNIQEYRGDTLVGNSQREMTFLVKTCTVPPPSAGLSDPVNGIIRDTTNFQACYETGPFSFHIKPRSTGAGVNIKVSADNIPVGATFTVVSDSTPTPDATFTWTSTGVTPGLYTIYVTFNDDQCPIYGTNTIAYTITINSLVDITGTPVVCEGQTTTLSNATAGGSWISSDPSIATVGSATGVVTGMSAGTATITYERGVCSKTMDVTVNPLPSPITGTAAVCTGNTTSLVSASPGGVWSSSSPGVATIDTASGIVTGVSPGTATISYTFVGTGCVTTTVVTVNDLPSAITGSLEVCAGQVTTLSSLPIGGTWISSNPANATIGITTGLVTGLMPGTTTITYTVGTGCEITAVVTVNPLPNLISPIPATTLCVGNTQLLSNSSPGGSWTSGDPSIASIDAGGLVTANATGVAAITYTLPTGCFRTKNVTVNTSPTPITPTSAGVCSGSTITLSNTVPGGTWSTSAPAIATVDIATGVVSGISFGTATISYIIGTCIATRDVTVSATPAPITGGVTSLCSGESTTWTNSVPGGTWTSSDITIATVGSLTGVVTGDADGTATITYGTGSGPTGCFVTRDVTVNLSPTAITTGAGSVCVGSTITYGNSVPGGAWTSGNIAVATVDTTTGVITGVSAGTADITYSIGGCYSTAVVTVSAVPAPIDPTPPVSLCVGDVITLSNTTPGGTWSSSDVAVATIDGTGLVTSVAAGTTTISYDVAGCAVTKDITVNATPAAIAPASPTVCEGDNTTLTNSVSGGVWSSSNTSVATVGTADGVVSGVVAGTATISYTIGSCAVSTIITVNPAPAAITPAGPISLCEGETVTLSDVTAGGVWSSSAAGTASVDAAGLVSAVSAGVATISYTVAGCSATKDITVGATPAAILPASPTVCAGDVLTLTNSVAGGSWISGNTSIATIGLTSGIANGVSAGTTNITYSIGGCATSTTITVNPSPAGITPATPVFVCVGETTTLSNATAGGVWSSTSPGTASIDGAGLVTGLASGTTTISYLVAGCAATKVVTVGPSPAVISPAAPVVCVGDNITLTNSVSGGIWTSSNVAVASIGATDGVATGVTAGTATITYGAGGCNSTVTITVNTTPPTGTISGPAITCVSVSNTYTSTITGGVWSTVTGNASITSGGVATGVSVGVDTIQYTVTNSCGSSVASYAITVNPFGSAGSISGPSSVCVSGLITLTNTVAGGVWSSSNSNATVGSTSGIVTGILPGLDTISYTITGACGSASTQWVITVNSLPTAGTISGPTTLCEGSGVALTSSIPGGTWSASNSNVTVGSTSGVVIGVSAGTSEITYTLSNSCGTNSSSVVVTVNPLPGAGTLTGPDSVCTGSTITLSSGSPGGVWSAGNGNATVSPSGVVTGVSTGTVPISYTVTNSCGTTSVFKIITVVGPASAGSISGPSTVCVGSGITLVSSAPGGVWSTTNGNAMISAPGIVVGVTVGIDTVVYNVSNLCSTARTRKIVTVNPVPTVGPISGPTSLCLGSTITLTNGTSGGNWTSSDMAVATVGLTTGLVNGVSIGTVDITYTVTNSFGCPTSVVAVDTVMDVPVIPAITGNTSVCIGGTTALGNATTGGTWSSSDAATISVDASGVVTGVTMGTATISYTVTNMCGTTTVTRVQTVAPLPIVAPITGVLHQCIGGMTTLSSATTGGTWISSDISIATADTTSGDVTGVSAGTATITYNYTDGLGCSSFVTATDTVFALPTIAAITGSSDVCIGGTTTLANATTGGVWSSSDGTTATVGSSSGIVSGMTAGTVTISYTVTNAAGCSDFVTFDMTVNALPSVAPITGVIEVCIGSATALSSATAGGTWSSGDVAIATVDASGNATGVSVGTADITYTFTDGAGCTGEATTVVTVNALPVVPAIAGTAMECVGGTTTLSNSLSGGVWSSSDASVASVDASGVVSGIVAGTAVITYSFTDGSGCTGFNTVVNTVNALPVVPAITGVTNVCVGATETLSNAMAGGTWASSDVTIASIDAASGVVSGVATGITTITYTVTDGLGCTGFITTPDTVNFIPASVPLSGPTGFCVGATGLLTGSGMPGVWSSSDVSVATVDASGIVTGISDGTATISYSVSNACGTVHDVLVVSVNAVPSAGAISASISVPCAGTSITMSNTVSGGVWSSSDMSIATIDAATGVVAAVASGTVVISYTVTSGVCSSYSTYTLTVGPEIPGLAVLPVGSASLCNGNDVNMHVSSLTPGLTYQWYIDGNPIAGATNSGYITDTVGDYSVTVSNGVCDVYLVGTNVVFMAQPVVAFNPPNRLFTGSYFTYQWYKNGVLLPGETSPLTTITGPGGYSVITQDVNGCTDTSEVYYVTGGGGSSDVGAVTFADDVKIYPNPASSVLNIEAPVPVAVVVTTMDGRRVVEEEDVKSINVDRLSSGLYLIMVYDKDRNLIKTSKFTKTN